MDTRQLFERWFSDEGNSRKAIERGTHGEYKYANAAQAWIAWEAAANAEREACARVAEGGSFLHENAPDAIFGKACAGAIRKRSNVKLRG